MEIRVLVTPQERLLFSNRLSQARAQFGCGYKGVSRGPVDNEERLRAATLLGLFSRPDDPVEAMLAGMSIHDLQTFPQSCADPDLSHLPPSSTFECGDHWALTRGAGMQMWRAAAIYIAHRKPAAVLAYLAVSPAAHAGFYAAMGFRPVGRIQPYQYLETSEGNPVVQGMVLDGEPLRKLIDAAVHLPADRTASGITRFNNSGRLRQAAPPVERPNSSDILQKAA